jgi:DNA-binding MarR family transcriptional regulator
MTKKKTSQPSSVGAGPGLLMTVASFKWQRSANEALDELDLSPTQFAMLSGIDALSSQEDSITQTKLARFVGADMMLTSKHVRELEARDLVNREEHPTDTRARSLSLTREGSALLKKAIRVVTRVDKSVFADAPGIDRVRKALADITGWE